MLRLTAAFVTFYLLMNGPCADEAQAKNSSTRDVRAERAVKSERERIEERTRKEEVRKSEQNVLLRQIGIPRSAAKARLNIYEYARRFYSTRGLQENNKQSPTSYSVPSVGFLYAIFGRPAVNRPDVATALLGPAMEPGIAILSAVPETPHEFANVFGESVPASRSALTSVKAGNSELKRIQGKFSTIISLHQASDIMRTTSEATILIVGHNEGGILVSPTGSRIQLSDIARSCAKFGKLCVFLSCKAAKHVPGVLGPEVDISPLQASRIAEKIAAMLRKQPTQALAALIPEPKEKPIVYSDPWRVVENVDLIIKKETIGRARVAYIGSSIGSVFIVTLVLVEFSSECDDSKKECHR